MNWCKNLVFVIVLLACLPLAAAGFVAGLTVCGLRGGYMTAEDFVRWVTR